jgi:leucyl aminopeptidase (aminopeptidase T)
MPAATQSQFDEGKIAAERTVASRNARNNSLRSVHGHFAPNQVSWCLFSKAHGAWTVRAKFYADARRELLNIIYDTTIRKVQWGNSARHLKEFLYFSKELFV